MSDHIRIRGIDLSGKEITSEDVRQALFKIDRALLETGRAPGLASTTVWEALKPVLEELDIEREYDITYDCFILVDGAAARTWRAAYDGLGKDKESASTAAKNSARVAFEAMKQASR